MTELFARNDKAEKNSFTLTYINVVSLLVLPLAALIFMFSKEIVQILFGRGAFNENTVLFVSRALKIYALGIVGASFRDKVNEKIKKYMPIISIMCIGIYLIELYITRNTIEIGIWNYTELLEWFLIMGTGLAMVITVSQSKRLNNSRVLSYIGQNTLLYYALHQNICRVISHLINGWDCGYSFSQTLVGQWIFTIIFAIFILLILVIPIEFIKRKMKYLTRFVW